MRVSNPLGDSSASDISQRCTFQVADGRKLFHAEVPDVPEIAKCAFVFNQRVLALVKHGADCNLRTTLGQILALVPAPVLVARFQGWRFLDNEFS